MREIRLYDGKAYGYEVSKYGLENRYLDYLTLSKIIGDCILNVYMRLRKIYLTMSALERRTFNESL